MTTLSKAYTLSLFLALVALNYLPSLMLVVMAIKIFDDRAIVALMLIYFIAMAFAILVTCALFQALDKASLTMDPTGETWYVTLNVATPVRVGHEIYLICRTAIAPVIARYRSTVYR